MDLSLSLLGLEPLDSSRLRGSRVVDSYDKALLSRQAGDLQGAAQMLVNRIGKLELQGSASNDLNLLNHQAVHVQDQSARAINNLLGLDINVALENLSLKVGRNLQVVVSRLHLLVVRM